jgi:transposase
MESTGNYCYRLADSLIKAGRMVYIVNPLQVKHFARMGLSKAKTDKIDARQITSYGELAFDSLRPYQFAPRNLEESKQIFTVVAQFKKQRTALYNQLEAISQLPYINSEAVKSIKMTIKALDKQIWKLSKIARESVKSEHKDMMGRISGITGIGEDTAALLITITGAFTKFDSAKQLSSYFGCAPRTIESGSSIRARGAISKIGFANIRTRLYMCSLSATRYNLSCKELYKRLLKKGKAKNVALLAVANKLIRQIFAIAVSGEIFDNSYEKKLVS